MPRYLCAAAFVAFPPSASFLLPAQSHKLVHVSPLARGFNIQSYMYEKKTLPIPPTPDVIKTPTVCLVGGIEEDDVNRLLTGR